MSECSPQRCETARYAVATLSTLSVACAGLVTVMYVQAGGGECSLDTNGSGTRSCDAGTKPHDGWGWGRSRSRRRRCVRTVTLSECTSTTASRVMTFVQVRGSPKRSQKSLAVHPFQPMLCRSCHSVILSSRSTRLGFMSALRTQWTQSSRIEENTMLTSHGNRVNTLTQTAGPNRTVLPRTTTAETPANGLGTLESLQRVRGSLLAAPVAPMALKNPFRSPVVDPAFAKAFAMSKVARRPAVAAGQTSCGRGHVTVSIASATPTRHVDTTAVPTLLQRRLPGAELSISISNSNFAGFTSAQTSVGVSRAQQQQYSHQRQAAVLARPHLPQRAPGPLAAAACLPRPPTQSTATVQLRPESSGCASVGSAVAAVRAALDKTKSIAAGAAARLDAHGRSPFTVVPIPSTVCRLPVMSSTSTAVLTNAVVVPAPALTVASRVALAMGRHRRLGANAPPALRRMPVALLARIFSFAGGVGVCVDAKLLERHMAKKGKPLRLHGVRDRVTRVHHHSTGTELCLKSVAHCVSPRRDAEVCGALLAAYSAGQVVGPCVTACYGVAAGVDDSIVVALQYGNVGSVQDLLRNARGVLPEAVTAAITLQMLVGWRSLQRTGHDVGYFVTASRVLVTRDGSVALSGFECLVPGCGSRGDSESKSAAEDTLSSIAAVVSRCLRGVQASAAVLRFLAFCKANAGATASDALSAAAAWLSSQGVTSMDDATACLRRFLLAK